MNEYFQVSLVCLSVITACMLLLWLLSTIWQDASLVDRFWGFGFVLITWLAASMTLPPQPRTALLVLLVTIWGMRLSAYLYIRNRGHGEDRRYQAMRRHYGPQFWWVSLLTVFLLQGLLLWLISLPIQFAAATHSDSPLAWFDLVGGLVWFVGILFETIGDWQLARFKANPLNEGRVMDRGLWRYSRHPNYFGDFCVWWGIYFVAASGGATATIASPLLMSFLLMRVSGVTLLESTITERRPDYADYQSRTSPFFPWFPSESRP